MKIRRKKVKRKSKKKKEREKKLEKFPSDPPPLTPSLPSEISPAFPDSHLLPTLRQGAVGPYMPLN